MSFRNRLSIFFVVLVILPMIVVAVVGFVLAGDSQQGKVNAQLSTAQRSASGLFREFQGRSDAAGRSIAHNGPLAMAIRSGDRPAIQAALEAAGRSVRARRSVMRLNSAGRFDVGAGDGIAPARTRLVDASKLSVGELMVSVVGAADYARLASRVTGAEVVVEGPGGGPIASTLVDAPARQLPARGAVRVGGRDFRLTGFDAPGFDGRRVVVRLLADDDVQGVSASALEVVAILVIALILAFAFALTVSRSLHAQIERLLEAAKKLARGDFSVAVPTEGNDEFAALGSQFNSMARELERRLEELQLERARLRGAIRRVGETFAEGLDRDAVLRIVVQTAMDGVGADAGRAALRVGLSARFEEVVSQGDAGGHREAMSAAEAAAVDAEAATETRVGAAHALSHPLRAESGRVLGLVSVARRDEAFTDAESELFSYLANRAGLSIENADLHQTVRRQAVTDELTGLFNHRRFQEVMATEMERAKRFHHELGLIMLDLDNFKRVNDTYGHMQGDLVLREVARVLKESSREVDEPARYGGEEMAVALPQTDLDGAYQFAERVRQRIEALELPLIDGPGSLHVTASFGAAAVEGDGAADKDALVAAADAALYRAKRSGKNRTVRAE